jgi:fatty acid desaturase
MYLETTDSAGKENYLCHLLTNGVLLLLLLFLMLLLLFFIIIVVIVVVVVVVVLFHFKKTNQLATTYVCKVFSYLYMDYMN